MQLRALRPLEWWRDLRYAARLLRTSPGYFLVVCAVLGVGIGANLAVFGLLQALALSPLPGVTNATGIDVVLSRSTDGQDVALSYPDYRYVASRVRSYESLAGSLVQGWMLGRGRNARQVFGELVSGNYFSVLGVSTPLGRPIQPSDDSVGAQPVAVLSDSLWRRAFGADPSVVGQTIEIDNVGFSVIGVAAPGFQGSATGLAIDIFVPYRRSENDQTATVFAFGRPRAGQGLVDANSELAVLAEQLTRERPRDGIDARLTAVPIWRSPQGAQTYMLPAVLLMAGMAGLLLVVVCANVAGLVHARALDRHHEVATRLAVGAGRASVVRLFVFETLLLATPGAFLGWALLRALGPYLADAQPASLSIPLSFQVSESALAFAAALLACASAVVSSIIPALRTSRVDLVSAFKGIGTAGRGRSRLHGAVVVSQAALAIVLLVGTALVTRSLHQARQADLGFEPDGVVSATIDLLPAGYDEARGRAFYQELLRSLRADSMVQFASVMKDPLLSLVEFSRREFEPEGYVRRPDEAFDVLYNVVGTEHFPTLRIPMLVGREFEERDDADGLLVVIVNDTFARRHWGSAPAAIGRRLRTTAWPDGAPEWRTVIGVAQDLKYARLTERPRPYAYLPHQQAFNYYMSVHVRGAATESQLIEMLRRHIAAIDEGVPVIDASTLAAQTSLGVGVYDVTARMLAIVGLFASVLVALGIYGAVSQSVKRTRHEAGVRLALGSTPAALALRFTSAGVRLAALGCSVGIAVSVAVAPLVSEFLYGVTALDIASFSSATAGVLVVALVASALPAWRVTRIDPVAVLRGQ
jgi:predicted permease